MKNRILLIDNEEGLCRMMAAILKDNGFSVGAFTRSFEAVESFKAEEWDLVISDIKMPGIDGIEVLQRIKAKAPGIPVIMITAYATVETAIQALRRGAYDMLTKPFEPEELIYRVRNALQQTKLLEENRQLREELVGKFRFDKMIGSAPALKNLLELMAKVAVRDTSVLITGESGTGKELVAQALHYNSPRRDKRFVAINCGALSASLLESELFGYKKGAFTGAAENRKGLLEAADGGTLFLDEVGNLPMNVQKTLLRFLQEHEFLRIGDTQPIKVDVRIISATNADLSADTRSGTFREDLFYRLNVLNLRLPPLRERGEDISLLASHFIQEENKKFGTKVKGFTAEASEALQHFPWPGNIRQLRNVIEACMAIGSEKPFLDLEILEQFIEMPPSFTGGASQLTAMLDNDYTAAMTAFETDYLKMLLRKKGGNIEEAAREAGMNMATIYRKIKKYGLKKEDYC